MIGLSPELEAARKACLAAMREGKLLCLPQASVYFTKLQKLQRDFDAAFLARSESGDPYAWEFLNDYNRAELEWLLAIESFSTGSVAHARVRLLRKVLAARGIRLATKN